MTIVDLYHVIADLERRLAQVDTDRAAIVLSRAQVVCNKMSRTTYVGQGDLDHANTLAFRLCAVIADAKRIVKRNKTPTE